MTTSPHIRDYNFDDKTVLITGAGRGFLAASAKALAARGAKVGICDRVKERAENVVSEITAAGGEAMALRADVGIEAEVMQAADELAARFGPIDILVCGAGSYGQGFRATHETPVEEWDDVFASNVRGTFLCAKAAIPHMLKTGKGRIVNISSNAGRATSPLLGCSYTAAKTTIIGISRHLSREYADKNILVNTLCPGPIDGDRVTDLLSDEADRVDLAANIPVGRLATPEDIAAAVLFLASDNCGFMTGAVLDASGGLILA